jgi:hypothetical protein
MSDDLIRRSDAIKALCKLGHEVVVIDKVCSLGVATEFIDAIRAIPPADRPQGEWIKHEHGFWTFVNDRGERDGWLPDYECNLCGSRAWRYATNYCPNCGCRMKGADDE